jgi:RNA polymerase primary sigma factor
MLSSSGEAGAASRFLEHVSTTLWSIGVKLAGDGADAEAAFLHIVAALQADDHARLRGFDGRSRLTTYLSLVARDVLADQLAGQFSKTPHQAWERFSRYFGPTFEAGLADNCRANSAEPVARTRIRKCASS